MNLQFMKKFFFFFNFIIIFLIIDFLFSKIFIREMPVPRWELDKTTCLLVPKKNLDFSTSMYWDNKKIYFFTNNMGYRENKEINRQKNLNLVIGDSNILGHYINSNETVSHHLNELTNQSNWINGGSFGGSPLEYYYAIKEIHLKKNRLDLNKLVVFINYWNDVPETSSVKELNDTVLLNTSEFVYNSYRYGTKSVIKNCNSLNLANLMFGFLDNNSFFFRKILYPKFINSYFIKNYKQKTFDKKIYWSYYNGIDLPRDWKTFFKAIENTHVFAKSNNISIDFVLNPVPWEISNEYLEFWNFEKEVFDDFQKPRLMIINFLKKNNIEFLDLTKCFRDYKIGLEDKIFLRDNRDTHYTSKGNKLVAKCYIDYKSHLSSIDSKFR